MTANINPPPLLVKPKEACRLLGGISERHLWQLTKDGKIASVKLGRLTMYPYANLVKAVSNAN